MNKKLQENKLESRWFVTNYSSGIYEQLQVHNFKTTKTILSFRSRNTNGFIQRLSVVNSATLLGQFLGQGA